MTLKIAVIGAGINGISSALVIQETIPGAQVTVISEKFSPNTTSDVAAGLIEPYLCDDDVNKIMKWTSATIRRIQDYMAEGNPGADEMSGYWIQSVKEVPKWLEVMRNVRVLDEEEMKKIAKRPEHKFGVFYSTWYLEPTPYIKWETEKFLKNGGKIIQKKVENLNDVAKEGYDVFVNCSGLGSRKLVGDEGVYPTRGQIIKVSCPRVKHFFIDDNYYALLNDTNITLGGTKDQHQWDQTIDFDLAKRIFEGNCQNVPSLRSAHILSHHVDLRPSRATVRLEIDSKNRKLIHNYGHGGSGITLHWGCALECADLVKKLIDKSKL